MYESVSQPTNHLPVTFSSLSEESDKLLQAEMKKKSLITFVIPN